MNKINSCIYLFCRFPVFNPAEVPKFESFDERNSVLLYSSLMITNKEIIDSAASFTHCYYCIDVRDKEFIPHELQNAGNIIWGDTNFLSQFLITLNEKFFSNFHNNIIIIADSIGTALIDYKKFFNLLSIEDNAIILGKTYNNKISSLGFNLIDQNFINDFNWTDLNFDAALISACRQNAHLNVLNNSILIQNISDFKKLYIELSKKESLAYCSQKMHERFTHLFIEYRELLK